MIELAAQHARSPVPADRRLAGGPPRAGGADGRGQRRGPLPGRAGRGAAPRTLPLGRTCPRDLAQLAAAEAELIDAAPRPGAHAQVAFLHPRTLNGVLWELAAANEEVP